MNDLEEFLNSMGLSTNSQPEEVIQTEELNHAEEPAQSSNSLSEDDFNDILSDMGFQDSPETDDSIGQADDEEIYNDTISEERDLDAEEDADWQEAIDSGGIVPVVGPNNQRVSMTEEEASQINAQETLVEDNQVHFHMPDGATVDVPIIHSAATDLANANTDEEVDQVIDSHPEEFLIPPNSPTLLQDDSTSRFSGTEWYNEIRKQRIILAGCGGIGSWTALQLARMSPEALFIYDDDIVEIANMSGQLYGMQDIGIPKVDAIARTINSYTTAQNIYALNQRFTPETEAGNIMICGFDNMLARRTFFDAWQRHVFNLPKEEWYKCLYIDGRLSIDTLQVLCITGDNAYAITEYRDRYLFNDSEADATVCSMKQTTYLACMIGSFIVNLFTNHVANLLNPIIPYDLPFFTEYDAQNMIFKTEN